MQTSFRLDGANCPNCFSETLDELALIDGVHGVCGSAAGPCIEIVHDDGVLGTVTALVHERLHGVEMFANELEMVPVEPVSMEQPCVHHRPAVAVASTAAVAPTTPVITPVITPSMTLGDIVTRFPSLAVELERHGLDYCCHGLRTLAAAAGEAGLDAQAVASELSAARVDEPAAPWATLGPLELVEHIESVHHRYLWAELPRISALVDKIVIVHGDRHPELREVQRLYALLRADLEPHLMNEEDVVFPMIRHLIGTSHQASPHPANIDAQLSTLASEHETVGGLLEELRSITDGYQPPADGCATYAACYRALGELEADTHLHVHKESNVLFPSLTDHLTVQPV